MSAGEFDNHTGNTISGKRLEMCVDSGASEHYFDYSPGLGRRLSDYEILEEPRKITAAGQNQPKGDATGVITGAIIDNTGVKQSVTFPIMVVPGLGRDLFLVPKAKLQDAVTTVDSRLTHHEPRRKAMFSR